MIAENIGTLMERVSLNSVQEIDRLIDELETLKARLQNEANRIQSDIVGYATLSQSAMQSTRVIAESLTHWRKAPRVADAPSVREAHAPAEAPNLNE